MLDALNEPEAVRVVRRDGVNGTFVETETQGVCAGRWMNLALTLANITKRGV